MNLPSLLWDHRLENGQILVEFVGGNPPSRLSLADLASFREIWENRLVDAHRLNRKDLETRANAVLRFLSKNSEGICMLMWPKHRISALFSEHSGSFELIDETISS